MIVNVSEPTNPKYSSLLNLEYGADGVFIKDNYSYVAGKWNGVMIIDVNNPENPTVVADMLWLTFYGISGN